MVTPSKNIINKDEKRERLVKKNRLSKEDYMEKHNQLVEGKIGRTLLNFAVPFLIASLLQALYGAADLFVVGRYRGADAVSAVAIGSQVMQTITGIILGISMGGTVLIGRCVGERNDEGTAKAVGTVSITFILLAAILTPIMLFFTNEAVQVMHTPEDAQAYTRQYIFICASGIPFIVGYNAVSGIFRGLGDSKTPVYFISMACFINIIMDFVLVGGVGMGARGAALATVCAQGISFVAALIYMYKKGFNFELSKRHFKIDKYSAIQIFKVGLPLALQDALVNISFLVITSIINTMGVIASAAVGIVEKIIAFAMLPPSSFASAVATMTAQNMGANKPKRAIKSLGFGILYSLICGIAVCVYSQFLPQTITTIFTTNKEVAYQGAEYLKSYSIDCILVSFIFCMNAYFSGCGKSLISMAHSLAATLLIRIPVSYLLSKMTGITLYIMGFAPPAASMLSIIVCFIYFFFLLKRMKQDEQITSTLAK